MTSASHNDDSQGNSPGLAETLRQVAGIISSSLDLQEVLEQVLEQVRTVVPYDMANIMLLEGDIARVRIGRGYEDPEAVEHLRFDVREVRGLRQMTETRQPMVILDTAADPDWVRIPPVEEIRSWMGVPLIVRNRVIGFLALDGLSPGRFGWEQASILSAFAHQAAIAIENARLYEEAQRRRQETETLREAALALSAALDRGQVIERILTQLQKVVPYDSASVQLLQGDKLEIIGGWGFPNLEELLGVSFPVEGDNPNREVMRTLKPFILEDAPAAYEAFAHEPHSQMGIHSWLGVPMLIGEQPVGVIALDRREPGFYTEEHARLAQAFAQQAAVAIENARLYEKVRQRAAQLRTINEIGRRLTTVLDPQELFQRAASLIRETYDHYAVNIFLLDEGELLLAAMAGDLAVPPMPPGYVLEKSKGITWWVVEHGEPLLVSDVSADPRFLYYEGYPRTASELAVPIRLEGEALGVLDVQSDRLNAYDQSDVELLTILADQLAVAIRTAHLYEQERTGRRVADTLRHTSTVLGSTLDLDELLRLILEQLGKVIRCDSSSVLLREGDTVRIVAVRGLPERANALGQLFKVEATALNGQVLTSKEPIVIGDVRGHPGWAYSPFGEHVRAWIGAPLIAKGEAIGLLCVDNREPGAYTEEDARLVTAFANHAAIAIENARLYEGASRRAVQLRTINEIGRDLTTVLDPQELFQRAASLIRETYDHYAVNIYLQEEDELRLAATASDPSTPSVKPPYVLGGETGIIRWAFDHGEALLVPDVNVDPRYLYWEGLPDTLAELAVPIRLKGRVLGVLDVESNRSNAYDQSDVELLTILADQLAVAIRTARIHEKERAGRRVAESLRQTSAVLGSTLDGGELLSLILEQLSQVIHHDTCSVLLQEDDSLRVVAVRGWPEGEDALGHAFNLEEASLSAHVLSDREPLVIANVHGDSGWARPGFGEHIRAWIGAPLIAKDEAIGLLCVDSRSPGAYTEEDAELVMAFANHAAIAIENARLYEASQRRLRQLTALQEVSLKVGDSLELPTVLDAIAGSALRLVDADDVHIFLYDDERDELHFGAGMMRDGKLLEAPVSVPRPDGVTYTVAHSGQPVVTNDPLRYPLFGPEKSSWGLEALVGLPLKHGGRVVGVLNVACTGPHRFTADEVGALDLLAQRAAVAIENAQLVDRLRDSERRTRVLYEELRQRLKELQTTQARLVQSEKMAAVGQLVSGVAHELNNPLTTVIGYTQLMLQANELSDEVRKDAQRIYDAAERSAEIVRSLLTFARQRKPERALTNVNDAIEEALSLRRYQLRVESIELVCDLDPSLPLIMANPHRLQEVVLNLVINGEQAILETQTGGRLVIRSRARPGVARIEVEDSGPGIPEEVMPHIFEPFFTTKEVGQGTGLGLSICYGIVEEHGGHIWAESRQGPADHGTTFIVELPVEESSWLTADRFSSEE